MSFLLLLAWNGVAQALPPLEIEAGYIGSYTSFVSAPALRTGARTEIGGLGLTGAVIVRSPLDTSGLADLTHTLVAIADQGSGTSFQQPVNFESMAMQVLVDWDFGLESRPPGISGGMRVYGGAQYGIVQEYYAQYDGTISSGPPTDLDKEGTNMAIGPVVGAAYDVWLDGMVGLNFGGLYRGYYLSAPQYDPDVAVTEHELEAGWSLFANLVFDLGAM